VDFIGICDLGMSSKDVYACAEITAEGFAQELGVPLFHAFEDLMNEDPGALIVTCETADHHRYALPAIEAGVHIFSGKPLTTTVVVAREIAAVASRHPSVVVQPGEPARYEDAMIQARQSVQAGDIGKPLMAHLFVNHPAMTNHPWQMSFQRSGGPFVEFGTYVADLAEWIVGSRIKSVYALGKNFLYPQVDGPDNGKLLCEHENGTLSSLDICCSITWNYPFLGLEIVGECGCLRADYHNYPLIIQKSDGFKASEPRYASMNQREIEHFLECIFEGKQPIITVEDYVSTIAVIEAALASLQLQGKVEVMRSEQ
jgi:predicted dehydrogenase